MKKLLLNVIAFLIAMNAMSQNPIITSVYTADPAAMVHNDTVFLYTGHDEAASNGNFYVMNDWQLFTSTDMVNWTSRGEVFNVSDVSWASGDAWAGEVEERNGKFYFYFCAEHKTIPGKAVGVAVSDNPYGPFNDIGAPLITNNMTTFNSNWDDIDPTVYIDDDGQAYMYWGNSQCYYVKLKTNMTEIDGSIVKVPLPSFTEAPYIHKANDTYYLSYAYEWPEKIAYATSNSITGPWTFQGVLNDNITNCGTNHQSIIELKGQSYFIYHTGDIGGDYRRSVAIEYLYYNPDHTIKKNIQTPYGVQSIAATKNCNPVPVTASYSLNGKTATNNKISVKVGDNLSLTPTTEAAGNFSFTDPSDNTTILNTLNLSNINKTDEGTYFVTFENPCGTKSYTRYDIVVNYGLPEDIKSGSTYIIEVNKSGKVVTMENSGSADGSNVVQAADISQSSQRFITTFQDDVYWRISPENASSKGLDVFNISLEDDANIVIWEYWGGVGQQWQIAEVSDGIYNIISRNSGKCLDVNFTTNNIRQWTCTGAENQQFKIVEYSASTTSRQTTKEELYVSTSSDSGNLLIKTPDNDKITSLTIYDLNGTIWVDDTSLKTTFIDKNYGLQYGAYMLQVKTATTIFNNKIIVN